MTNRFEFAKMHGAGNDFVVVAANPPAPPEDAELVRQWCDRRRGIGADGALWMERLDGDDVFRMHFYNCDGGRVNLCLNGSRCVARRAVDLGWAQDTFQFQTEVGTLKATVGSEEISLRFPAPASAATRLALPSGLSAEHGFFVDTGDPHLVLSVGADAMDDARFLTEARTLRHWTEGNPTGFNVHFVHRTEDHWRIRSYERGIEGETLACGSGCISATLALAEGHPTRLRTAGGDTIAVEPGAPDWTLKGPAVTVFTGHTSPQHNHASSH